MGSSDIGDKTNSLARIVQERGGCFSSTVLLLEGQARRGGCCELEEGVDVWQGMAFTGKVAQRKKKGCSVLCCRRGALSDLRILRDPMSGISVREVCTARAALPTVALSLSLAYRNAHSPLAHSHFFPLTHTHSLFASVSLSQAVLRAPVSSLLRGVQRGGDLDPWLAGWLDWGDKSWAPGGQDYTGGGGGIKPERSSSRFPQAEIFCITKPVERGHYAGCTTAVHTKGAV